MKDKYKTLITACWAVLGICFIIKILGGNFFEIICTNEFIIKVCDFIDSTLLFHIFNFVCFYVGSYLYYKAVLQVKHLNSKYIFLHFILITAYIIKLLIQFFVPLEYVTPIVLITDTLFMIAPVVILNTKVLKRAIIGYVLVLAFQAVSMITKSLGIHFAVKSTLLVAIFSIDYYIMLILYYLYSIQNISKKGGN